PCPDLILLDLQLSDMRGEELIARLDHPDCALPPVIVITAKRQQAAEMAVDQIGAVALLLKPFEIQELLDQIELVLT
ncbi:MAG TPA: response regulator, partial [Herpetosiphonaceae bacterium]